MGSGWLYFDENSVDVVIHGKSTGAFGVVSGKVDVGVKVALPVFGDVVVAYENVS